jgi:hypothetical protein
MERSADISTDGLYRWRLERRWSTGTSVVWIMLNPSTADAEKDDPTIERVIAFSREWGHDAAVVVNLVPFRSPDPREAERWAAQTDVGDVLSRNDLAIAGAIQSSALTLCAWGASKWARSVGQQHTTWFGGALPLCCLGVNSDGSPRHPLARGRARVPSDQEPRLYAGREPSDRSRHSASASQPQGDIP